MSATLELVDALHVSDRTLRRAVSRGLLRGVRSSPNKLHITAAERDYARSHWPLLERLVGALRTEPGVRAAVLYGSVAKGLDRPDSDVDIAIDLRPDSQTTMPALERRLSAAAGRKVHAIRIRDALVDGRFALEVIDAGRPLVDRDEVWSSLQLRRPALARKATRQDVLCRQQTASAWARLVKAS